MGIFCSGDNSGVVRRDGAVGAVEATLRPSSTGGGGSRSQTRGAN
ncbi:hypothetical protein E2C01_099529 [Portunus trituberculatus]|uniref:Uncharacterized protein n=1 Tax=Portunus trituberculatus TaxID=210409 RepID=A0A5B7K5Q4_PORTR|nr:hypothetical protein [Portunus trituberculatus]